MTVIGKVPDQEFHIYKGKSFSFDVLWWLNKAKTEAAVIASARGKIKTGTQAADPVLIDLAPTFTANRVMVRLTPAQTLALVGFNGFLEVEATAGVDTKIMTRGRVVLHSEVSE